MKVTKWTKGRRDKGRRVEGLKGTKGTKGTLGTKGTKGTKGTNGTKGANGTKGSKGTKGAKRAKGAKETKGVKWARGLRGVKLGETKSDKLSPNMVIFITLILTNSGKSPKNSPYWVKQKVTKSSQELSPNLVTFSSP